MNYKSVFGILGRVMIIMAISLLIPLIVGIINNENLYLAFLLPVAGLLAAGIPCVVIFKKGNGIYAKEGFVIVALAWILMSLVGALPFVISGEIPNYIDALFETVSGFTTTGASILSGERIEGLSKGMQFWRIFTHFLGGMGVLVLLLALLPSESGIMHIYRAESPGPTASKLVSKMSYTARILYAIYIGITILEIILLSAGGMDFYDSVLTSLSTAGTGGLSPYADSIAHFNSVYIEMVVAVFMFIFGVNFNLYYLILTGCFLKAIKSEEFRIYLIMVVVATLIIAVNLLSVSYSFGEGIRYAFFQVTAVSSTTGFATKDFNQWPALSKCVLLVLMVVGASGGSTGGGMKVSRFMILVKSSASDLNRIVHPHSVNRSKFEGEVIDAETVRNARNYFIIWVMLVGITTLLLCIDVNDLLTNFTAALSCIGNVGPGLNLIGPAENYALYSPYSKILLSLIMLAGRLEIFPMVVLFAPATWKK